MFGRKKLPRNVLLQAAEKSDLPEGVLLQVQDGNEGDEIRVCMRCDGVQLMGIILSLMDDIYGLATEESDKITIINILLEQLIPMMQEVMKNAGADPLGMMKSILTQHKQ